MIQQQPRLAVIPTLCRQQVFRCFRIQFDNNKRKGRFPLRVYEAYGIVFPSGHVTLDTEQVERRGYESMTDLLETLAHWGHVEVEDLGEIEA